MKLWQDDWSSKFQIAIAKSTSSTYLLLTCWAAAGVLLVAAMQIFGSSFDSLKHAAQSRGPSKPYIETLVTNDGRQLELLCKRGRAQDIPGEQASSGDDAVQCSAYIDNEYILKYWIFDRSDPHVAGNWLRIMIAPRFSEKRETASQRSGNQIKLASDELSPRAYSLGQIQNVVFGIAAKSFNLESEAVKALFLSSSKRSANVVGESVDDFSLERLAQAMTLSVAKFSGVFEVRKQSLALLMSGPFESIILLIFFFCVVGTVVTATKLWILPPNGITGDVNNLAQLVSSLSGSLTYLGLLGTLLGIYFAVRDLSAIDFADEMMKVFDQTEAFGSMSLALGTSVLGLAGSLILWFLQASINYVLGARIFEA